MYPAMGVAGALPKSKTEGQEKQKGVGSWKLARVIC